MSPLRRGPWGLVPSEPLALWGKGLICRFAGLEGVHAATVANNVTKHNGRDPRCTHVMLQTRQMRATSGGRAAAGLRQRRGDASPTEGAHRPGQPYVHTGWCLMTSVCENPLAKSLKIQQSALTIVLISPEHVGDSPRGGEDACAP